MGRHFEVRAASMAATAKKKSAIYMRASKEIYMAAKSGTPDPNSNLALRSAIEKYRKSCPKDVIERAIKKAAGGEQETYIAGRYEAYGPGNCYVIVDTLTDNVNRTVGFVRAAFNKVNKKISPKNKKNKKCKIFFNFTSLEAYRPCPEQVAYHCYHFRFHQDLLIPMHFLQQSCHRYARSFQKLHLQIEELGF